MEATSSLVGSSTVEKYEGKHLIFELDNRGYGIPILTVNEIIGIMDVTKIPRAPVFIKGVINLRGKVIPVMDLRLKFGMVEKEYDEQTCIIIVNVELEKATRQIGVIVDVVSEVVNIPATDIEPPPEFGRRRGDDFLNGVGKIKDKVVMLLNIQKIIYTEDVIELLEEKTEDIKTKKRGA